MARLITKDNLAIVEYPPCENPTFDIGAGGELWVYGYKTEMLGKEVRSALKFDFKLQAYTIIGNYKYARKILAGDLPDIFKSENIDKDNSIILMTKESAFKEYDPSEYDDYVQPES